MIDNPLENQVMEDYNSSYINEKYEEHCADRAKELAEINNLENQIEVIFFLMINILLIAGGIIIKIYMKLKHLI